LIGRWDSWKPGLILSFDDPLRSLAQVAARVVDRCHTAFTTWYFFMFLRTERLMNIEAEQPMTGTSERWALGSGDGPACVP